MKTLTHRNIFVVEDNKFYAGILKNELETFCGEVSVFASGEECLEHLKDNPDVVLLDYNLSGNMSGIDVLKKIKEYNEKLPVVFISGNYKMDVVKDAIRFGADDFIDKTDTALSMLEIRLKHIFHEKTVEIDKRINKMAKKVTIGVFMFMLAIMGLLFLATSSTSFLEQ